ncbi:MAG: hypothetical protein JXO22_07165 [Phycisphaerae bacterium]|nr:hypothetical protein [Phycisphaerae bacterium]
MRIALVVALALIAAPAMAIDTPYVAGDFQGWDAGANPMTDLGGGMYEFVVAGLDANSRHEFKITDGTWGNAIPGANCWFYTDGTGSATLTYNKNLMDDGWAPNIDRIGVAPDLGTWTAVGSFQGWDNANAATAMMPVGDGTYVYNTGALGDGTYQWKAVNTGSWDSISWDGRSVNTANMDFTLDATYTSANLFVNPDNGTVKVELLPEPASIVLVLLGLAALRRR